MAVISEVKCGRCDRRYSGFRSRCPYCGARRNKRGKRADEAENAQAKLIIGIALLVVLIGATMVLIFTSLPAKSPEAANSPAAVTDEEPAFTQNEDVTQAESSPSPTEETASPSPTDETVVQTVAITYTGKAVEDATLQRIGETLQLRFTTTPATEGKTAVWTSADEKVFQVVDGKVTAVGKGSAKLTCTVDGVSATCVIRVRGVS
jgi:cytoskeletal protein RodZ